MDTMLNLLGPLGPEIDGSRKRIKKNVGTIIHTRFDRDGRFEACAVVATRAS